MKRTHPLLIGRVAFAVVSSFHGLESIHGQERLTFADAVEGSIRDLLELPIDIASKRGEPSFESPLSTSVITRDEILRSGAASIPEALRLIPGVIVREITNGSYDVHIRGFDYLPPGGSLVFAQNTKTLVMIDNRIVYNYFMGGVAWESLPVAVEDVERVEVIRGPSAALYGPNGATGVIHILTRNPAASNGGGISLRTGGTSDDPGAVRQAAAHLSGRRGRLSSRFTIKGQERDRFQKSYFNLADGVYTDEPSTLRQVSLKTPYTNWDEAYPDPLTSVEGIGTTLKVQYDDETIFASVEGGLQDSRAQTVAFDSGFTPLATRDTRSGYLNAELRVADRFRWFTSYLDADDDLLSRTMQFLQDTKALRSVADYRIQSDLFEVLPSFEVSTIETRAPFLGDEDTHGRLTSYAPALKIDATLDPLRVVAAVRGDLYAHRDRFEESYHVAATYRLSDTDLLRAATGAAKRAPFIVETFLDAKYPDWGIAGLGDRHLDLQTVRTHELGYRSALTGELLLDAEVFLSTAYNFTEYALQATHPEHLIVDDVAYDRVYRFREGPFSAQQLGTTCALTYHPTPRFKLLGHATYQHTELDGVILVNSYANRISDTQPAPRGHRYTPRWFGGVVLSYLPWSNITLQLTSWMYSSQRFAHNVSGAVDEIPSNVLLGAHLDLNVRPGLTLSASLKNLSPRGPTIQHGLVDRVHPLALLGCRFEF
jgi:iron complex outermembrane recepter protein